MRTVAFWTLVALGFLAGLVALACSLGARSFNPDPL